MNSPRQNRQQCLLPDRLIPDHVNLLYKDILVNSKLSNLYNGRPMNCIQETLLGLDAPGININLLEQTFRAPNNVSTRPQFFPRNANHSMTRPDNEMTLKFRHIDGYHNYWMLYYAINYSQNLLQQSANQEQYINLGNIVVEYLLTEEYSVKSCYFNCSYSSIDGFSSMFSGGISNEQFSVVLKFVGYQTELWRNGEKILGAENTFTLDQTQTGPDIASQEWPYERTPGSGGGLG